MLIITGRSLVHWELCRAQRFPYTPEKLILEGGRRWGDLIYVQFSILSCAFCDCHYQCITHQWLWPTMSVLFYWFVWVHPSLQHGTTYSVAELPLFCQCSGDVLIVWFSSTYISSFNTRPISIVFMQAEIYESWGKNGLHSQIELNIIAVLHLQIVSEICCQHP